MAAKEQKLLQQFEDKQTEEERSLKQKLDSRLISQKQYDAAVAASEESQTFLKRSTLLLGSSEIMILSKNEKKQTSSQNGH